MIGLGNIVSGVFTPVLAKPTKHLSLVDTLSVGVDRMQRSFEPMRRQVETWRTSQLSDEAAKLIIYRTFIAGELEVPRHLARVLHNRYFDPRHEEFAPRTMWSLSNAFTSAFKELDSIPQFQATARLVAFLEGVHAAWPRRETRFGGRGVRTTNIIPSRFFSCGSLVRLKSSKGHEGWR